MFGYVFSVWEREQEFMTSSVQIPHICGGHAWLINSLRFRSEPIMRSWTEIFAGIATKSNIKTLPSCDGYFKSRATRVFHPHSYTRRPAISNAVSSLIFYHCGPGSILNSTRVDVDWVCWFSAPSKRGFYSGTAVFLLQQSSHLTGTSTKLSLSTELTMHVSHLSRCKTRCESSSKGEKTKQSPTTNLTELF